MKFLTFAEMRQRVWTDAAIAGICAGTIGVIFDYAFPTWPLFTTVGVAGGVSTVVLLGYVYIRVEQMRADEDGASIEDTQPTHPVDDWSDLTPMPRTFEKVQEGYWRVLDLNRAAGRPGAALIFMAGLSRNGGDLRVETWKAHRGVGREAFERMRAELARMGYVTTGAKGAYQWTDSGRKWLASLPR